MFELVEEAVQIQPVKHQARALAHSNQPGPPHFIEGATLHAYIFHGLLVGQAAFWGHAASPMQSSFSPDLLVQKLQMPFLLTVNPPRLQC